MPGQLVAVWTLLLQVGCLESHSLEHRGWEPLPLQGDVGQPTEELPEEEHPEEEVEKWDKDAPGKPREEMFF